MPNSKPYHYIRAWGEHMGSYPYYINDQIAKARTQGAPENAIYEKYAADGSGRTGVWAVASEVVAPGLRNWLDKRAAMLAEQKGK